MRRLSENKSFNHASAHSLKKKIIDYKRGPLNVWFFSYEKKLTAMGEIKTRTRPFVFSHITWAVQRVRRNTFSERIRILFPDYMRQGYVNNVCLHGIRRDP